MVQRTRELNNEIVGAIVTLLAVVSACGGYTRVQSDATRPSPRISWVITEPAANGGQQTVCRSEDPTKCVLPASTAAGKKFASVYLYLHPTAVETTYAGRMRVGFFNGFAPDVHARTIESVVRPGDAPFEVSVTGPITPIASVYTAQVDLLAASATQFQPQQIGQTITVTAK